MSIYGREDIKVGDYVITNCKITKVGCVIESGVVCIVGHITHDDYIECHTAYKVPFISHISGVATTKKVIGIRFGRTSDTSRWFNEYKRTKNLEILLDGKA